MLTDKMQGALNGQLNAEAYSAYLYLSMAAYLQSEGLSGCASWMRVQAREELVHAMKFFDFVNEQGGRVLLAAIEQPQSDWDSPGAVFEAVLAHEKKVTGLIGDLAELAGQEDDQATGAFLEWFAAEQVEEEESASGVLQKLQVSEGSPEGLSEFDAEMGKRQFHAPS